jgi:hypothetical protein
VGASDLSEGGAARGDRGPTAAVYARNRSNTSVTGSASSCRPATVRSVTADRTNSSGATVDALPGRAGPHSLSGRTGAAPTPARDPCAAEPAGPVAESVPARHGASTDEAGQLVRGFRARQPARRCAVMRMAHTRRVQAYARPR